MGYLVRILLRVQRWSIIRPSLRRWLLNRAGARIHPTAVVEHSCWIASPKLRMAAGSLLNAFTFFDGAEWLIFEENTEVAVRATIITRSHPISADPSQRASVHGVVMGWTPPDGINVPR